MAYFSKEFAIHTFINRPKIVRSIQIELQIRSSIRTYKQDTTCI